MSDRTEPRARRALRWVTCAALALGAGAGTAQAGLWESTEHNVLLEIPDAPAPWDWLPESPDWAKAGIVKGARRTIAKLKSGHPADGHGALLHVAVLPAPKDKSLDDVAGSADVRKFLLTRFAGTETNVVCEDATIPSGDQGEHPAKIIRAEGQAANLNGKDARCVGVLIVALSKGKLHLARLYAFPSEFDAEGAVTDLDYMEGGCLTLISTKEEAAPPPPPDGGNGGAPQPDEEEGKEEVIEHHEQGWRITKHAKVTRGEISDEERSQDIVLKFEGSDTHGTYQLILYAIPHGRIVDGQQLPPPDLSRWMTYLWWQNFTTNHPEGDIHTWKFPRRTMTKAQTWITLPYMDDEKNLEGVVTGKEKRPVEVSASEAEKLGFVEKPKKKDIGRKGSSSEAMRGCLQGNRARVGIGAVCRYAWRTSGYSYRLFLSIYGEAYKKWGDPLRATLESLEFGVDFK